MFDSFIGKLADLAACYYPSSQGSPDFPAMCHDFCKDSNVRLFVKCYQKPERVGPPPCFDLGLSTNRLRQQSPESRDARCATRGARRAVRDARCVPDGNQPDFTKRVKQKGDRL